MSNHEIQAKTYSDAFSRDVLGNALPEERAVICPVCYRTTDSLKSYSIPQFVFILFYIVWNHHQIVACPSCMRKSLLKRALLFIPLANIFFPLLAIIYVGYF